MYNHQEANIFGLNMRIDRDYLYFRAKVSASDTKTKTSSKKNLMMTTTETCPSSPRKVLLIRAVNQVESDVRRM